MIPKALRTVRRDKLQRTRQQNGKDWEQRLEEEIDSRPGCWARRWSSGWNGQPFDISAMCDGHGVAIECKRIQSGNLRFSALRPNEVENLERFRQAGGTAVLAIERAEPPTVAFVLWDEVADAVMAGERGSIPLSGYPHDFGEFLRRWC